MGISILHVLAPAAIGGLERVVQALAAGHAERGHRVGVVAIVDRKTDHPFIAMLERDGLEVRPLEFPGRSYLRERRTVASLIEQARPDVVHTHGYRADVLSGSASTVVGVPTVTTVHGFTGGDWKNRLYERLQTRAFRRFSRVVAVSRPLAERLRDGGVPADRICVVRNAWRSNGYAHLLREDARAELGVGAHVPLIGWIGRLSREKGPDIFVDALERLQDTGASAVIIGDGPDRQSLEARTTRSAAAERVHWMGLLPEAARYLPAFDVVVLSSRTEGTPIVLLEAMAAGVPVIATAVGGVPDVVSEAEAVLVSPGDPTSLADAIRKVLGGPAEAAARAERAGQRLAREFAMDPWLDAYEDVYRTARISNGNSSPA